MVGAEESRRIEAGIAANDAIHASGQQNANSAIGMKTHTLLKYVCSKPGALFSVNRL